MTIRRTVMIGVMLYMVAFSVNAQIPAVLGVWKLNIQASNLPAKLFPAGLKSETRSYYQRADGFLVVLAVRFYGNGVPEFIQVAARSDGRDYPQYQSAPL